MSTISKSNKSIEELRAALPQLTSDTCRLDLHQFKDILNSFAQHELTTYTILQRNGTETRNFLQTGMTLTNIEWDIYDHGTAAGVDPNDHPNENYDFGNPIVQRPIPTPPLLFGPNANAQEKYIFDFRNNHVKDFNAVYQVYFGAVYNSLDKLIQEEIKIDGSLLGVTLPHIMTTLQQLYGIPRKSDLAILKNQISIQFNSIDSLSAQMSKLQATFVKIIRLFPTEALSEQTKIDHLQANISSIAPINRTLIQVIIAEYKRRTFQDIRQQTYQELMTYINVNYEPEDVSTLKEYGFAHAAVNHHHQHGVIDSSMSSPISIGKFYTEEDFKKAVTKEANSIKKADKKTSKTGGKGKDSTSFCFIHGLNRHAGSDCRMLLPYKSVFPRLLTESNTTATHFGFTSSNEGLPKKQQARFLSALAEQFMAKK